MKNEIILLLTYYYKREVGEHRVLKHIRGSLGHYLPFDLYLYEPLRKNFSRVILYDYLEQMIEIGVKAVNEQIIALIREYHPKYVLWTPWRYDILESTLDIIREEGSIVIGWFFDDEWRFDDYSKWWIPYLDYCVTNSIEAVPKYRELGARVIHTIPNTGIAVDRDWSNVEEKYGVSFVGNRIADREQWINELKSRSIPIHLFGEGWGGYISFEEMIDIFKTSKINLNFSRTVHNSELQLKGRIFQVCMAGGFLLTEYVPRIEKYFDIDKEIVCFESAEEMIDKVTYYLNHETERRAIAQAGWKRATSEYTSFHMLSKVLDGIEEDVATKGKDGDSRPRELRMPMRLRRHHSIYHFQWGRTLLEENYKGLWKDALALSISYNPFNIRAWYYYIASFLPSPLRFALFRVYAAIEKVYEALLS
ncbi:glycosyltransferase [Chloroflexota bacterium]